MKEFTGIHAIKSFSKVIFLFSAPYSNSLIFLKKSSVKRYLCYKKIKNLNKMAIVNISNSTGNNQMVGICHTSICFGNQFSSMY